MSPALECRDLSIGYGQHTVVERIDVTLQPGQALALVGTNGSGKSTLLKTIMGLIDPMGGTCRVLGAAPGTQHARVAYLGQAYRSRSVLPLQARDVVKMGRYASLGLLGRAGARDRELVRDALEQMGITHLAGAPLRSMSGGQQQRVFLAQVAAREGDLLVLDEPTAGLDMGGAAAYRELVSRALARGASVVTATHDIADAQTCDQAILLAGRIVANGSPRDVLTAEHLLDAFGIALQSVEHQSHRDLIITEQPHEHEHEHGHGHGHGHDHE